MELGVGVGHELLKALMSLRGGDPHGRPEEEALTLAKGSCFYSRPDFRSLHTNLNKGPGLPLEAGILICTS